jgi:hypothetical protein
MCVPEEEGQPIQGYDNITRRNNHVVQVTAVTRRNFEHLKFKIIVVLYLRIGVYREQRL